MLRMNFNWDKMNSSLIRYSINSHLDYFLPRIDLSIIFYQFAKIYSCKNLPFSCLHFLVTLQSFNFQKLSAISFHHKFWKKNYQFLTQQFNREFMNDYFLSFVDFCSLDNDEILS